ncbi:FAD/NAD(P)-binding protein [Archangium violaceum]|uniref:FAD/NAD(P)-binding protein n=1 Tax=Archangium violaceum TaxID=83451 RepID=UPI00193AEDFF|nr:FAD/NAD(P)-binding domain-containing protein [Archangium violaceum]QRK10997.1 FAD/NAD(P)-binding protein [Archangium violaceum]
MKNITIVGGGASAIALLSNLAEMPSNASAFGKPGSYTLRIIETAPRVGPGRAYRHLSEEMILNTDPDTMGIRSKDEFKEWLLVRGHAVDPVPRRLFARYLNEKLEQSIVGMSRIGVRVELVRAEVRGIKRHSEGYALLTDSQGLLQADILVLAVGGGHGVPYECLRGSEQCLTLDDLEDASPALGAEAEIVVLGSSQSAIDAALFLSRTTSARITLASRGGGLPLIKGTPKAYTNQRVRPVHERLSLQQFMGLLEEELLLAEAYPSEPPRRPSTSSVLASISSKPFEEGFQEAHTFRLGWQAVMKNLTPHLQPIYENFSAEEKLKFVSTFFPSLRRLRSAIPLRNAEKLSRLINDKRVRVMGGVQDVQRDARSERFVVTSSDARLESRFIVNATGLRYMLHQSPLLSGLGFIRPNLLGGVKVDVRSMRVLDGLERPDPTCYCLGLLSYGDFLITNSMETCAAQARTAAGSILRHLSSDDSSPLLSRWAS